MNGDADESDREEWYDPMDDCEAGKAIYAMQTCSADGSSSKWGSYTDSACSVSTGDERDSGPVGTCHNDDERGMSTMTGCSAGVVTISEYDSLDCAGDPMEVHEDGCHNICDDGPRHESGAALCVCSCVCEIVRACTHNDFLYTL